MCLLAAAEGENEAQSGPYHVIGGHLVAVVAGLIGYHVFASGLVVVQVLQTASPFAGELARLSASSVVAMTLTTIGMLLTDTNHPAACATTLIVSLGDALVTLRRGVHHAGGRRAGRRSRTGRLSGGPTAHR